jgi:hypothetical protein
MVLTTSITCRSWLQQPQRPLTGAHGQFPWCGDTSQRAFFIWGNRIAPAGGSRRRKVAG